MGNLNLVQIGGIFLFLLLILESLIGRKVIKVDFKVHKNLSLILLAIALGHAVYGYSIYGFSSINFLIGILLFISISLGTYIGFNISNNKLSNHKYLAYTAALLALYHALSGLGFITF